MKKPIQTAISKLQRSGKITGSASFTYKGKDPSKQMKGKIYYDAYNNLTLAVTSVTGFHPSYVRSKANTTFNALLHEVLPLVQAGDTVWTKAFLTGMQPGKKVTLSGNDYYYAVDGGLIDCNGRQLGNGFQAIFERYNDATCSTGGAIMKFSIFKLL